MLVQAGLNVTKEELLNKLSPSSDGYETELTLMAEVRGYYTVAYKVCLIRIARHWVLKFNAPPSEAPYRLRSRLY